MEDGLITYQGDTTMAINRYLSDKQQITDDNDEIPDDFSEYGTGEAKFRKISILSSNNQQKRRFFFSEEINIVFELEVFKDLPSVTIGWKLVNNFGETIMMDPLDKTFSAFSLEKKKYRFRVKLNEVLLPGEYYITLTISQYGSGSGIDFVPMVKSFEILKESVSKVVGYPWDTVHGYSIPKTEWKQEIIE